MNTFFVIKKKTIYLYACILLCALPACDKDGSINVFSVEQDVELGKQVSTEIEANPAEYPLLPETGRNGKNEQAYQYIRAITSKILNSGQVAYKEEFAWQVKIVQNDEVLNAFCTPGGYIYVYTGLIKYLDTEDQLAGVMGHEIAHADKRHTTDNLTKQYGIQLLLDVVLGTKQGVATEIAKGLANLSYSRAAEREADDASVVYLCPTGYKSDGAAGFFEKMQAQGDGGQAPEFLSTHPNPDNRIESIKQKAQEEGCNTNPLANTQYQTFKSYLP
jgi:beta-barrel assembly-enhancing protease